jgi:hypothetical protein
MDTAVVENNDRSDPLEQQPDAPAKRGVGRPRGPYGHYKPRKPVDPKLTELRMQLRQKPKKVTLKTLSQIDLRTSAARRVHQLVGIWQEELGGVDNMTESLRQLIQRAALLSVLIEANEAEWLTGGMLAEATYFAAINSQRRILLSIGLDRRSCDITPPTIDEIAADIASKKLAEEEAEGSEIA